LWSDDAVITVFEPSPASRQTCAPSTTMQREPVTCALIIGRRKESTDKKTSLNDALRDFGVSV